MYEEAGRQNKPVINGDELGYFLMNGLIISLLLIKPILFISVHLW